MKTKLLLIATIICCSLLSSCQKEDIYYSCDEDVDKWVKNNYAEISVMTRSEWIAVGDITYQKALYNAFSPAQRFTLWMDKLTQLFDLFSRDEDKMHVEHLISTLKTKPEWFSDNLTDADNDSYDIFFYKWINYAQEKLEWDMQKIYALIGTPENVVKTRSGEIIVESNRISAHPKTRSESGGGYGNVCECGDHSYILCSIFTSSCRATNDCTVTQHGCGPLWSMACWGTCHKRD